MAAIVGGTAILPTDAKAQGGSWITESEPYILGQGGKGGGGFEIEAGASVALGSDGNVTPGVVKHFNPDAERAAWETEMAHNEAIMQMAAGGGNHHNKVTVKTSISPHDKHFRAGFDEEWGAHAGANTSIGWYTDSNGNGTTVIFDGNGHAYVAAQEIDSKKVHYYMETLATGDRADSDIGAFTVVGKKIEQQVNGASAQPAPVETPTTAPVVVAQASPPAAVVTPPETTPTTPPVVVVGPPTPTPPTPPVKPPHGFKPCGEAPPPCDYKKPVPKHHTPPVHTQPGNGGEHHTETPCTIKNPKGLPPAPEKHHYTPIVHSFPHQPSTGSYSPPPHIPPAPGDQGHGYTPIPGQHLTGTHEICPPGQAASHTGHIGGETKPDQHPGFMSAEASKQLYTPHANEFQVRQPGAVSRPEGRAAGKGPASQTPMMEIAHLPHYDVNKEASTPGVKLDQRAGGWSVRAPMQQGAGYTGAVEAGREEPWPEHHRHGH